MPLENPKALGHRNRSCSDPCPKVLCAFRGQQTPLAAQSCSLELELEKKVMFFFFPFSSFFVTPDEPTAGVVALGGAARSRGDQLSTDAYFVQRCVLICSERTDSVTRQARQCCHCTREELLSQLATNNRSWAGSCRSIIVRPGGGAVSNMAVPFKNNLNNKQKMETSKC